MDSRSYQYTVLKCRPKRRHPPCPPKVRMRIGGRRVLTKYGSRPQNAESWQVCRCGSNNRFLLSWPVQKYFVFPVTRPTQFCEKWVLGGILHLLRMPITYVCGMAALYVYSALRQKCSLRQRLVRLASSSTIQEILQIKEIQPNVVTEGFAGATTISPEDAQPQLTVGCSSSRSECEKSGWKEVNMTENIALVVDCACRRTSFQASTHGPFSLPRSDVLCCSPAQSFAHVKQAGNAKEDFFAYWRGGRLHWRKKFKHIFLTVRPKNYWPGDCVCTVVVHMLLVHVLNAEHDFLLPLHFGIPQIL